MEDLTTDEKQQVLQGLHKRYFVSLAFVLGWGVCCGVLFAVVQSEYLYLALIVLFLPFMIGLAIYGMAEKDYGKLVTQRQASFTDWLLRSRKPRPSNTIKKGRSAPPDDV